MINTLAALLERQASTRGNVPAIIADVESVTFAELDDRTARLAAGLSSIGIGVGDAVGVWLPNIPAYLEVVCACARIGAIAISCNTRFRSVEIADLIQRSAMKALVLWPGFERVPHLDVIRELPRDCLARLSKVILIGEGGGSIRTVLPAAVDVVSFAELHGHGKAPARSPAPEEGFITFMTSGTTNRPKFALHSQASVVVHGEDVATAFGYRDSGSVVLTANPLCGVFGLTQAVAALAAGIPQVLPTIFDAAAYAAAIRKYGVTHTNAIDEALQRILEQSSATPAFPGFRSAGSGSYNSDFAAFVRSADQRGFRTFGIYGMSEVLALYSKQPTEAPAEIRARAGGKPVSRDARVRARDPETGAILPHGEVGELEIKGPSLMIGYLHDEAATRKALTEDGYLRTGDAGSTNADGSFNFQSRMGDALRLAGFLVNPSEISTEIESHPAVGACQVVGARIGSAVKAVAFVISKQGADFDEKELLAYCSSRIAPFKRPVRILAIEAFPKSVGPNGEKVQLNRLREIAQDTLN